MSSEGSLDHCVEVVSLECELEYRQILGAVPSPTRQCLHRAVRPVPNDSRIPSAEQLARTCTRSVEYLLRIGPTGDDGGDPAKSGLFVDQGMQSVECLHIGDCHRHQFRESKEPALGII